MESSERIKLSKIVDKLSLGFGFSDNDWKKETFNLLIGALITKIRLIKEKKYYDIKAKKKKNPLLYWEIGKEINEFIKRRKNDIRRFGKEFKLKNPYSLISNLIVEAVVEDNKSKWEGFTQKRTFEACYFLYLLDPEKQKINPEFPWSFYFEFTQQRKLLNLRPNSLKRLIYSEIVNKRKSFYFSDKTNRKILKEVLELSPNKINKTNINKICKNNIKEETSRTLQDYTEKKTVEFTGLDFINDILKETNVKMVYKKLSRNDVSWAEPKSRSHQSGILIPKIFFSDINLLPINTDIIDKNPEQSVFQAEIKILWITQKGKKKLDQSNLKFYKSKNEGRITICPKTFFYPKIPEYILLIKKQEEESYIIYLGEFGDKFFEIISNKFQLNTTFKYMILKQ